MMFAFASRGLSPLPRPRLHRLGKDTNMTQLAIVDHSGFGHTDDSPEVPPKAGDRATAA